MDTPNMQQQRVTLKDRIWSLLDVILRVPPVFIMDGILNASMGLNRDSHAPIKTTIGETNSLPNLTINVSAVTALNVGIIISGPSIAWLLVYSLVFLASFSTFLLATNQLLAVYLCLASVGDIIWSYVWNEEYIKYVLDLNEQQSSVAYELITFNTRAISQVGVNYLLQVFLAMIFCFSNNSSSNYLPKRAIGLSFIGPTVLSILPLPKSIIICTPLVSAAVAFWYICFSLLLQGRHIYNTIWRGVTFCRSVVRHYGLYTLLEDQWIRLHVPQVLRVFWLTRITEQAVFMIVDTTHDRYRTDGIIALTMDNMHGLTRELLIRGCETLVAIFGMTSVISSLSHYLGQTVQNFLLLEDPEDKSIGTVSAILFVILALQTGLSGMDPEKRFFRLYRNLCLLITAIFHFIHNMVNPLLLSLSASRNTSLNKHGRALAVCAFLILIPCWFLNFLWQRHTISTWLLAVAAFSIEVVIKVVISLLVYFLFMIDAYRNTFWEKLDDYVYYIRATGSSIEFLFGIFIFFNGVWILFFESGGTIRACMMCIHAYFNIWLQAKTGWKVFIKRRSAVNKINLLPEATEEQLRNFDDVCAICYQDLNNARITRCNHYFHGVCLRKWLYVQDICPLCHKTLYYIETDDGNKEELAELLQHLHQE